MSLKRKVAIVDGEKEKPLVADDASDVVGSCTEGEQESKTVKAGAPTAMVGVPSTATQIAELHYRLLMVA